MTAGVAADGTLAVAYLPQAHELTIDLSKLNRPVHANWFDPTDRSSKAIEGAPRPVSVSRWACDHFHGAKKSPLSNRDDPLT